MPDFKQYIDLINKQDNQERILNDAELYIIYNGQLRKQIESMIYREFEDPKTIVDLCNRIVPINITKKIIDKLGKCYKNGVVRKPKQDDDNDQELISMYEEALNINAQMSYSNKLFKLTKHCLAVPYLNSDAKPKLRIIPSHLFSLFSNDKTNPENPTTLVVHLITDNKDPKYNRYEVWTKDNFWIVDGNGSIVLEEMLALNNPEGINFYQVIPHVHITQQRDLLYPIRSSDIKSVQYAVCLLLSDCALAQKYMSWGTLLITGAELKQSINIGAGAVVSLPADSNGRNPDAKYLQPQLNSDEVIRLIEKMVEYLMTTNNLSAGTVIGQLTTNNAASGISKMLDTSESTEDIQEQQQYFIDAEKELWFKFAHHILPYWVESNQIDPKFKGSFSPEFELSIMFTESKPMLTEKERIENVKAKLDAGLITFRRALQEIYPQADSEEIDQLVLELNKEKKEMMATFQEPKAVEENQDEEVESGNQESEA